MDSEEEAKVAKVEEVDVSIVNCATNLDTQFSIAITDLTRLSSHPIRKETQLMQQIPPTFLHMDQLHYLLLLAFYQALVILLLHQVIHQLTQPDQRIMQTQPGILIVVSPLM